MAAKIFQVVFPDYPVAAGRNGSGGWSKGAKHRPQPVRCEINTTDVVFTSGMSVIVNGQRKTKCNIYVASTGEALREDYDTELCGFGLTLRQKAAQAKKQAASQADAAIAIAARPQAAQAAPTPAKTVDDAIVIEKLKAATNEANAWVAAGCPQPAHGVLLAAKVYSGAGWSQFKRVAQAAAEKAAA